MLARIYEPHSENSIFTRNFSSLVDSRANWILLLCMAEWKRQLNVVLRATYKKCALMFNERKHEIEGWECSHFKLPMNPMRCRNRYFHFNSWLWVLFLFCKKIDEQRWDAASDGVEGEAFILHAFEVIRWKLFFASEPFKMKRFLNALRLLRNACEIWNWISDSKLFFLVKQFIARFSNEILLKKF